MRRFPTLMLLIVALTLVACYTLSAPLPTNPGTVPVSTAIPAPTDRPAQAPNAAAAGNLSRVDEQGAVVVEVLPLNLGTSADTLEFDVAMNTHSVNLGMDLATLSTLVTDTGVTLQATKWEAMPGGHHVRGTLIFPATKDGKSILEGAHKLTLTILNVDAQARLFEWELR